MYIRYLVREKTGQQCVHLGIGGLPGLLPNGVYLLLDLGNFLLVATAFVVRDLSFKLGDLLGVLPVVIWLDWVGLGGSDDAAMM
jgi:hypothetical protein